MAGILSEVFRNDRLQCGSVPVQASMDDYRAFVVAKAGAEFQMLAAESNQRRPRLTKRDDVTHGQGNPGSSCPLGSSSGAVRSGAPRRKMPGGKSDRSVLAAGKCHLAALPGPHRNGFKTEVRNADDGNLARVTAR